MTEAVTSVTAVKSDLAVQEKKEVKTEEKNNESIMQTKSQEELKKEQEKFEEEIDKLENEIKDLEKGTENNDIAKATGALGLLGLFGGGLAGVELICETTKKLARSRKWWLTAGALTAGLMGLGIAGLCTNKKVNEHTAEIKSLIETKKQQIINLKNQLNSKQFLIA